MYLNNQQPLNDIFEDVFSTGGKVIETGGSLIQAASGIKNTWDNDPETFNSYYQPDNGAQYQIPDVSYGGSAGVQFGNQNTQQKSNLPLILLGCAAGGLLLWSVMK